MVESLDCPVCSRPLLGLDHAATELPVCERCGGAWLDRERSARVVAGNLSAEERRLARLAGKRYRATRAAGAYRSTPHAEGEARRCPDCEAPLVAHTVDALGIIVDACQLHGTWFDRGELRVAIRWFDLRAAGLDEETARLALLLRSAGKRRRRTS
ncbi:MAG: zf-TFIIB domain-containing protein [Myxococcales bacterium]|nr:zf-TFIIB domain-containing protein [Myxococcales bacterium]